MHARPEIRRNHVPKISHGICRSLENKSYTYSSLLAGRFRMIDSPVSADKGNFYLCCN